MKYIFKTVIILLCCLSIQLSAQDKVTLSGYVKDGNTGETLIASNVYVQDDLSKGTTTNLYGFYSLTLAPGKYKIAFSYLGFEDLIKEVDLTTDVRLNVEMQTGGVQMKEFVVSGEKKDANVESTEMGTVEISIDKIKSLPALMGEVDILKTIQLLPGIQSSGEGNSGFYVRGGGSDQNLILLDEAVVYNSGHLFGFFSVFNSDAIKSSTVIKGGMPARYGGRLSSVLDMTMKDGNNKNFAAQGGIGLISSRLTFEGPIQKDKSSFVLSGRRTYAFDLAQPAIDKTDFKGTNYYFYDLNVKANYTFSDKDRIFASGYFGRDVFKFANGDQDFLLNIPWGNTTATLRWNHLFSNKVFMNTSFIYNDYQFEFEGRSNDFEARLLSAVRDANVKVDIDFLPNVRHHIRTGINYTYHTFTPSAISGQVGETTFGDKQKKYAHEAAVYIEDEINLTDRISVNIGMRGSMFSQVGPYEFVEELGADTTKYGRLEPVKTYFGAEPRISAKMTLPKSSSIKAGINMNTQYLHLVSNSGSTLPTDIWVPSSRIVKPQRSIQYALGYFKNLSDNKFETSVEVYYKDLKNQVDYPETYVESFGEELEERFVFGKGQSYGAEFFFKKKYGKLNGWIGYTISRTTRTFDDINEGRSYPTKFDRTHDLSIVGNYELNDKWTFGATFVYGTGNAFTMPTGRYFIDFNVINQYSDRNSFRMPAYHRLDLAATYHMKRKKRWESDLVFSIYNVYNRKNPYFIYFDTEGSVQSNDLELTAKQVSLFPIIPSITWNFKWNH